nr:hypothetical protein E2R29_05270 [Burkholderia pseudomallei]
MPTAIEVASASCAEEMTRDESHTRSSCHAARPGANRPRKPPGIDALVQGLPRRAGDIGRNPPRNRRRLMPQDHPVRSACRKSVGRIGPRRGAVAPALPPAGSPVAPNRTRRRPSPR